MENRQRRGFLLFPHTFPGRLSPESVGNFVSLHYLPRVRPGIVSAHVRKQNGAGCHLSTYVLRPVYDETRENSTSHG